jgi:hypothetical protein
MRQGKDECLSDFFSLKAFITVYFGRSEKGFDYYPVREALIRSYQYAIAKFNIDGFRIDTWGIMERDFSQIFCNRIREFALSIGKRNFFIVEGPPWSANMIIDRYIGRFTSDENGIIGGVDVVLDFSLFNILPGVIKGQYPEGTITRKHVKGLSFQDGLSLDRMKYH